MHIGEGPNFRKDTPVLIEARRRYAEMTGCRVRRAPPEQPRRQRRARASIQAITFSSGFEPVNRASC
jgi:hypothetical protein